jgi:hypothetical protein
MSGKAIDPKVKTRRMAARAASALIYLVLVVLVFVFGKGHSLLIDNKAAQDGSYAAIDGIMVSVDGREPLELYAGDRDMVLLKGQSHSIVVEGIMDGSKASKKFKLPMNEDMLLLSVPKLLAGIEPYIEPFAARDASPPRDDVGSGGESFSSPEAPPEAPAP